MSPEGSAARLTREAVIRLAEVTERLSRDVAALSAKLESMSSMASDLAVLKDRQARLEKIVYGVTGLVLTAVVGAVLTLAMKKGP